MSKKEVATNEVKKEFELKPVFKLWLKKSKNGNQYLSGVDESGQYLTGFLNGKKENPKEPDIRVYEQTEDGLSKEEYTSLWCKVSKNGKTKFFTGKLGETWLTGFINSKATCGGKIPYISVYTKLTELDNIKKEVEPMSTTPVEVEETDDLPF